MHNVLSTQWAGSLERWCNCPSGGMTTDRSCDTERGYVVTSGDAQVNNSYAFPLVYGREYDPVALWTNTSCLRHDLPWPSTELNTYKNVLCIE